MAAYRSGFAAEVYIEAGIAVPALLDAADRPDGSTALWLQEVAGVPGMQGTPAQLGDFAHRLGLAHAGWLDRRSAQPWLSRDWLRDYTTSRPVHPPVAWDHPLAVAAWPATLRDELRALWEGRHRLLAETDRLPRTMCHHDVWPMNLIFVDTGPVLLDWSSVGPGALGEDAANLILDAFFDGLFDVDRLDDVTEAVLDGYRSGLGKRVDPVTVERAVMLTGAAKYFWLAPRMLAQAAQVDAVNSYDSRDPAAMFAGRRAVFELLARWTRRAVT